MMNRMRRKKGTGCVRKLSGNRTRPWQVIINHKKADGNRIRISLGTFGSYDEAVDFLDSYLKKEARIRKIRLKELFKKFRRYFSLKYPEKSFRTFQTGYAYFHTLYSSYVDEIKIGDFADILKNGYHINNSNEKIVVTDAIRQKIKTFMNGIFDFAFDHMYVLKNIPRHYSVNEFLSFV